VSPGRVHLQKETIYSELGNGSAIKLMVGKMNTGSGKWSVMIAKQQRRVVPCLLLRF